jgi:peptidoglycan hydrolase-like protein with peptidoglycan-binding domain
LNTTENKTIKNKKMSNFKTAFGFDTDALQPFIQEQGLEILTKTLFGGQTAAYLSGNFQDNVKYVDKLQHMDIEVAIREQETCGLVSSGNVIFSQKEISVASFYDQKTFCPKDLEPFYTREFLPKGSTYENMPIEQAFLDYYGKKIANAIEVSIWQGDGSGANPIIGFNKTIDDQLADWGVACINGNPTGITTVTGISTTNVIGIFQGMVNLIPTDLAGSQDLEFVCGWDTFRKLLQALFSLNNFHYGATEEGNPWSSGSIVIPSFGLRVNALAGLDGSNRIHLAKKDQYVIGTDMQNEYESNIDVFYDRTANVIISRTMGKLGTQIKFASQFITFKLV